MIFILSTKYSRKIVNIRLIELNKRRHLKLINLKRKIIIIKLIILGIYIT